MIWLVELCASGWVTGAVMFKYLKEKLDFSSPPVVDEVHDPGTFSYAIIVSLLSTLGIRH